MKPQLSRLALIAALSLGTLVPAHAVQVYVTAVWGQDTIHILDANLQSVSSFSAGGSNPNGIDTDGSTIYVGLFTTREVIAYDFNGAELRRWSNPEYTSLQGLTLVGSELATAPYDNGNGSVINFWNPLNGAFIRSIPNLGGSTVEGMAYDGSLLWLLEDSFLMGVNPADGSLVSAIANPALGKSYDGTALGTGPAGQLVVGANDGSWWRVDSSSGAVLASGDNDLEMYGLGGADAGARVPDGGGVSLALLAFTGLLGFRRWSAGR
jgi:DNA-binding beta-propeller fold protein YncE